LTFIAHVLGYLPKAKTAEPTGLHPAFSGIHDHRLRRFQTSLRGQSPIGGDVKISSGLLGISD
jgi:hypothetical protein